MKSNIGTKEKKNEVFEKEVEFISKLRHKNIISFYGFMTEPHYGIILEYCIKFYFFLILFFNFIFFNFIFF
jgi:serine/threonine protein kinase